MGSVLAKIKAWNRHLTEVNKREAGIMAARCSEFRWTFPSEEQSSNNQESP